MYQKTIINTLKILIIIVSIGVIVLCGCSGNVDFDESAVPPSSVFDYGLLTVEVNLDNHVFVMRYKETYYEGVILTYDYPQFANVYKIIPFDEEPTVFFNPIKEWRRVWFQALGLLTGAQRKYNDITNKYEQLSRYERNSVVESMTRQNISDLEQMKIIKSAYPSAVFDDYILKSTYPAIERNLYDIQSFDVLQKESVVIDTINNRSFDYYVIRRSLNGILVGTPSNIDLHYVDNDDAGLTKISIYSEEWKMFYDGLNIYEVHNNNNVTEQNIENYINDQPVLSFEQALSEAAPTITNILSDSIISGKETKIYAAELVYLTIQESDINNHDNYDAYLYPFWVIYIHTNYMSAGVDCAYRKPVLVNAITGEVVICN